MHAEHELASVTGVITYIVPRVPFTLMLTSS